MLTQMPDGFKFPANEIEILNMWKSLDLYKKILKKNETFKGLVKIDGPPFVSSKNLHTGHVHIGIMKSIFDNFWVMHGYNVLNKIGYDVHGLPIEQVVSKMLNLSTNDQIRDFGLANYNKKCEETVLNFSGAWQPVYNRIARFIDFENEYKTMDLNFMETVWWAWKTLCDKGLVYRGYRIMPYSTACGTSLSASEASGDDVYKEVIDPTVYVKFSIINQDNTYFVAWTTTPWTLPSNLALAMNPKLKYVKIYDHKTNEFYILAEACLPNLYDQLKQNKKKSDKKDQVLPFDIIETFVGKDFENVEYTPLFDYYTKNRVFKVIMGNFVEEGNGAGIVHLAPAFGADDFDACINAGIVTVENVGKYCPIDDNGFMTNQVYDYTGEHIFAVNTKIIERLKHEKKMLKKEMYKHSYPHCWRTDTPLIYKAVSSFFIKVTAIKDKIIANNEKVHWVPEHIGNGKFKQWLENAKDWGVSRSRFFGTPIPMWVSDDGQEMVCVGSIDELVQLANLDYRPTNLHPQHINHIQIPSKQGKGMLKITGDIFDCIVEGTPVSLSEGFSIPIEQMKSNNLNVLTYDKSDKNEGIINSKQTVFMDRGEQNCIELLFEDGRTLKCTPNHRILAIDDDLNTNWIYAKDIVICNTRIITSIDNPIFDINLEDKTILDKWILKTDNFIFSAKTVNELYKSMAFSRLLGYLLTDGSLQNHSTTNQIQGVLILGHVIDAELVVKDIGMICDIFPNINYNKKSNVYLVYLPKTLLTAYLSLEGIQIGRRINQPSSLPSFLFDNANVCPNIIKREFLGGLFGGDGCCPKLCLQKSKKGIAVTSTLSSPQFIQSKTKRHINSLKISFEKLKTLLFEFGINSYIAGEYETTSSKKNNELMEDDRKYQLLLIINDEPNSVLKFNENIGFKYCMHKQLRLSASASWRRMQLEIKKQNHSIVELTNNLVKENGITISKAYKTVINDLHNSNKIINTNYLVSYNQTANNIKKLPKIANYYSPTPYEWLKEVNALKYFIDETDENIHKTTKYALERNQTKLSTFNLKVIGSRDIGKQKVYDITVPKYESFVANGLVVHNCWFESGCVPFGQIHYPFENDKFFDDKEFLCDFICEAMDQTRGWFYTLMVLSTALLDKPAFKHCICSGLILADDGKKFSKRLGNFIPPMEVCDEYGTDALRLYLSGSPAAHAEAFQFNKEHLKEINGKYFQWFNGLKFLIEHTIKYQKDGFVFDVNACKTSNNIMDCWILSRVRTMLVNIELHMNNYTFYKVKSEILDFIEDLTNWYIKFNRNRLRGRYCDNIEQNQALSTLFHVMLAFSKIAAPFIPFITETIYQKLKILLPGNEHYESIHLCQYPLVDEFPTNPDVERSMKQLQTVVGIVRALRTKSNSSTSAKVPIKSITIVNDNQQFLDDIKMLENYLCDEVNVMNVVYETSCGTINYKLEPNNKEIGIKYRSLGNAIKNQLIEMTQDIINEYLINKENGLTICVDGKNIILHEPTFTVIKNQTLTLNTNEIAISEGRTTVICDFAQDNQVLELHIMRLFVVAVQKMRKLTSLRPWNKIGIYYHTDNELINKVLMEKSNKLKEELLYEVSSMENKNQTEKEIKSDEHEICGSTVLITITDITGEFLNK